MTYNISFLERAQLSTIILSKQPAVNLKEAKSLVQFADDNNLWVENINVDLYVSQGAEQKVFLKDGSTVLKLNDAIYYASWVDYFHNLLLNNLFFPDTAYHLLGFYKDLDIIYAVVEQQFVKANEKTEARRKVVYS